MPIATGVNGPFHMFRRALDAATQSLSRNTLARGQRRGKSMIVKTRTPMGRCIATLANGFFSVAHVPFRFWTNVEAWQQSEVQCFRMLNRHFSAATVGSRAVRVEALPGESLYTHLTRGTLTRRMLRAAGREFRRTHSLPSPYLDGPWSHGDASLTNIIYDPSEDRARLIDFEVIHDSSLSPTARHADDLLASLCDLASFASERRWIPFAMALLKAYEDVDTLAELSDRLVPPTGIGWLWWKVRTNWVSSTKIHRRMHALREALHREILPATSCRRNNQMSSDNCRMISLEIPTDNSRRRHVRTSEMAAGISSIEPMPT